MQMGAMDTLMAQNSLTATMSAMLPGAVALAVAVTTVRTQYPTNPVPKSNDMA